jgi:hypothetical protein
MSLLPLPADPVTGTAEPLGFKPSSYPLDLVERAILILELVYEL